jgi:hypothetical protein
MTTKPERLRMTLTDALFHLCESERIADGEIIELKCILGEARELQAFAQKWFADYTRFDIPGDWSKRDARKQFAFLFAKLHEKGCCLQFIDSYPALEEEEGNLRVLIMPLRTLHDALNGIVGTVGTVTRRNVAPTADAAPFKRTGTGQRAPVSA